MTETITHIALKKLNTRGLSKTEARKAYTVLPNIEIRTDKRGCLVIDAPEIASEKVITNDIVEIIDARNFVWKGRFDAIVNSGALKLIPEVLEQKIATLFESRYFLWGIPDDVLGQKLILVVEGIEEPDMLSRIKASGFLNKYELPKAVYFLPEFIETTSQKIQKNLTVQNFILTR